MLLARLQDNATPTCTLTSVQPMPNFEYSTVSPAFVVNSRVCVPRRPSPTAAMSPESTHSGWASTCFLDFAEAVAARQWLRQS